MEWKMLERIVKDCWNFFVLRVGSIFCKEIKTEGINVNVFSWFIYCAITNIILNLEEFLSHKKFNRMSNDHQKFIEKENSVDKMKKVAKNEM